MDMGSFTYPSASPAVVSARQLASVPFLLRGGGGWRVEGEGKETRQVRVKVAFYTKRKMTGNDDTTDGTPAWQD